MWANREVAEFATWLRDHNTRTGADIGFYGLDVYSLWDSLQAVLTYLGDSHPDALDAARRAFRCFEPYGQDPQDYAWATRLVPDSCEDEVVGLLVELRSSIERIDGDREAGLDPSQNAEVGPTGRSASSTGPAPTSAATGSTVIGDRYDAFVSLHATEALTPLHPEPPAPDAEQETYPWSE